MYNGIVESIHLLIEHELDRPWLVVGLESTREQARSLMPALLRVFSIIHSLYVVEDLFHNHEYGCMVDTMINRSSLGPSDCQSLYIQLLVFHGFLDHIHNHHFIYRLIIVIQLVISQSSGRPSDSIMTISSYQEFREQHTASCSTGCIPKDWRQGEIVEYFKDENHPCVSDPNLWSHTVTRVSDEYKMAEYKDNEAYCACLTITKHPPGKYGSHCTISTTGYASANQLPSSSIVLYQTNGTDDCIEWSARDWPGDRSVPLHVEPIRRATLHAPGAYIGSDEKKHVDPRRHKLHPASYELLETKLCIP